MGLFGIMNWSGLYYDIAGAVVVESSESPANITITDAMIGNDRIGDLLTKSDEFPYDYGAGRTVYIVFLSLVFMGTIVLEGVDTSIMAKVTPVKLNTHFVNAGLLATLVGTLGRVLADGMITLSALLDINIFVDFVNATFMPILLLTLLGLFMVKRLYDELV